LFEMASEGTSQVSVRDKRSAGTRGA
jgi:hypothetical protein